MAWGKLDNQTVATGWTSTGYNFVFKNASVLNVANNVALYDATNGGSIDNTWNGAAPNSNGNFVAMDADYETGPMTQKITGLTIGSTYTLSFNYAFSQQVRYSGDTTQDISASFGGSTVFASDSPKPYTLPSHDFSGWKSATITVKADKTSEDLSFLAGGSPAVPPFALLADVSLTGGAVPEPASWAMMLIGLGAIGVAARRRGRAPEAA